jgi:hypothetical protein
MDIWKLKGVRRNIERAYALCVITKKSGVTYLDVMRAEAEGKT